MPLGLGGRGLGLELEEQEQEDNARRRGGTEGDGAHAARAPLCAWLALAWPLGASDGDGGWKCKNENIYWIYFSLFIHYFFELQPVFKVKGAIFIKTKWHVTIFKHNVLETWEAHSLNILRRAC